MALIPERCGGHCMGLDGRDGPNLACAGCGQAVATRVDDCSCWQAVWLAPDAVRRVPGDGDDPLPRTVDWEASAREWQGTPPIESPGSWSPTFSAAVGMALAHLLAASGGGRVTVPGGLVRDTLGRPLDALLPPGTPGLPGSPVKRAALAGPGLPVPGPSSSAGPSPTSTPTPDILLVPRDPRTGEVWRPSSGSADLVPLAAEVWMHLAFDRERLPVPVTGGVGGMPDGVFRDYPLPAHPWGPFRPDSSVFLRTLARLPAVRQPWLRAILDRVNEHPYARPF
ncbi:hypothetical protein [Streptomyces sp. NBC_01275]|uniref:hypothetical protein n=1 Tax=Streptomyces sp. NBC_01275 TaxID=2903807 RepID=UPI002B1D91CB|nr:hypothetical protein [Streptomyces sp. NBC_01275]